MADLQPLGDRIVVQAINEEESPSGLVIPATAEKDKPQRGKVVALGTGKVLDDGTKVDFSVKVDDVVLFAKYAPNEVEVDGKDFLIMSESDVLAIVK